MLKFFSLFTGYRYSKIPRLKGNPFLGRLPLLFKENGVLENLFDSGKIALNHPSGMCYYWLANRLVLLVTKPEQIHQLLIDNHDNISRETAYFLFKIFVGSNLTVDPPDLWKTKKHIYSDWVYKPSILNEHEAKILALVEKNINLLQKQAHTFINLQEFVSAFTLETLIDSVILRHGKSQECLAHLLNYQDRITKKIFEFKNIFAWLLPKLIRKRIFGDKIPDPDELRTQIRNEFQQILFGPYEEEIKNSDNFVKSIYCLNSHEKNDKLIEDTSAFGDTHLLLLAGQETSITTFQCAIKLLSAHPKCEAKLREEIESELQNKPLSAEAVEKMPYLEQVLKETLRLFPPVPFLPRDVVEPFKIDGIQLSKKDLVIFSPYLTHRIEHLWPNPEKFDPERFATEQLKHLPPQAYLPFGAGSHMCIGRRFAWLELKLLITAVYQNFKIELTENDFELRLNQGAMKLKKPTLAKFIPIINEI